MVSLEKGASAAFLGNDVQGRHRQLPADELKALGGTDASAVAHPLAQKGDMTVWQDDVYRGKNAKLQQAPTAKIGIVANSSLRVEPCATPYAIGPHP